MRRIFLFLEGEKEKIILFNSSLSFEPRSDLGMPGFRPSTPLVPDQGGFLLNLISLCIHNADLFFFFCLITVARLV
jgi:hypothetical protein